MSRESSSFNTVTVCCLLAQFQVLTAEEDADQRCRCLKEVWRRLPAGDAQEDLTQDLEEGNAHGVAVGDAATTGIRVRPCY